MKRIQAPSHPPIDPQSGIAVVRRVIARVRSHGKRAALAGGLAMMTYGSDRVAWSVEIVTDDPTLRLGRCGAPLLGGGRVSTVEGVRLTLVRRRDAQREVYEAALGDTRMRSPWRGEPAIETLSAEWLAVIAFLGKRSVDRMDLHFLIRNPCLDRPLIISHCRALYGRHAYLVTNHLERAFALADAGVEQEWESRLDESANRPRM